MNNRATITIHTCDAYKDIWDTNIMLLNKNWSDRNMRTILVTDKKTDKKYDGVEIMSTGEELGNDMPSRLKDALDRIETEYTIFLLDDYYLTKKIDNQKINNLLTIMDENKIDYLAFDKIHKRSEVINEDELIYKLDINSKNEYMVCLYQAIWRTSVFKKMVQEKIDIWNFEVSLTQKCIDIGALCATSLKNQLPIVDMIRKGYWLWTAKDVVKEYNLIGKGRKFMPISMAVKYYPVCFVSRYVPKPIYHAIKK